LPKTVIASNVQPKCTNGKKLNTQDKFQMERTELELSITTLIIETGTAIKSTLSGSKNHGVTKTPMLSGLTEMMNKKRRK